MLHTFFYRIFNLMHSCIVIRLEKGKSTEFSFSYITPLLIKQGKQKVTANYFQFVTVGKNWVAFIKKDLIML